MVDSRWRPIAPLGRDDFEITTTTPAVGSAVDLTLLRSDLRLEDGIDDALVTLFANAAEQRIASMAGVRFLTEAIRVAWSPYAIGRTHRVRLPVWPVASLDGISFFDGVSTIAEDLSLYTLDRKNGDAWLEPVEGALWPHSVSRPAAIQVDLTVGYGAAPSDVPGPLQVAMIMLAGFLYGERHEASAAMPMGIDLLLEQFRRGVVA